MTQFFELGWHGNPYTSYSSICTDKIDEFYELLKEFKTLETNNKEQKTAFYQGAKVDKSKNKHRSTKEKASLWVIPDLDYDLKLEIKDFYEVKADYQYSNVFIKAGTYVLDNYGRSNLQLGETKKFGALYGRDKAYGIIKDVVENKKNWILDKNWGKEGGDEVDISLIQRLFSLDDKKVIVQIVSDIDIYKYRFLLRILFTNKHFKIADFGVKTNIPKICGYYATKENFYNNLHTVRSMLKEHSLEEILLALKHGLDIDIYEKINQGKT